MEKFLEENREWILKNRKDMKVYEEDTGVGLGIGAEIKTKLHVLRIVETEEPKPSYRLEQEKITLFIPKKVDFSKVVTDGLRSGTIFPIGVVVLLTIISVSISS